MGFQCFRNAVAWRRTRGRYFQMMDALNGVLNQKNRYV